MITNTKMHSSYSNDDKYKSVNDRVCTDCNIYGIFWVKVSQVLLCESVLSACFNPITLRTLLVLLLIHVYTSAWKHLHFQRLWYL